MHSKIPADGGSTKEDVSVSQTNEDGDLADTSSCSSTSSACSSDSSSVRSAVSECQDDEEIALALQVSLCPLTHNTSYVVDKLNP